jgi:hypothetical protein
MAAMSIYKVLRKAPRFGPSFRVCDSTDAGVGSCDQFLNELSLRDADQVTRQIVGCYITEFARGAKQGAVATRSAQKPRQPRTINHRLSVLASYFEYCIRGDTEDGRGPGKGRINPASGNPLTEELRHGMIGRDLPVRQKQRDGFRLPDQRDRSAHGSRSRPAEYCAIGPAGSISAGGYRVIDWNSSGHRRGAPHGRAAIRDTQLGSACVRVFNSCARGLRRGRQYSPGASSRFDGSTEGAAH